MISPPDLSICVVNHDTPELTRACLGSIGACADEASIEVLLVNNTPTPCPVDGLLPPGLPLTVLQNPAPLGFGANQNQMLARGRGRYLMPLNSDTVVRPGALRALVEFMDATPACGIAGPRLVRPDGALQPSCRNFPTALTHFLECSGLWRVLRNNRVAGRWLYLCRPHDRAEDTDWLSGACLIARAELVRQTGGYDAVNFPRMFGEDLDWCWRARNAGWRVAFTPAATIVHLEGQSPLDNRALEMYRATYRFCRRTYSDGACRRIRAATVLGLLPRWLLARSSAARATYRALMALPMPDA